MKIMALTSKYVVSLIISMSIMLIFSSCEKLNLDEFITSIEEAEGEGGKDGPIKDQIDHDGLVIKEGMVDLGLSVKWAACNLSEEGFCSSCSDWGSTFNWWTEGSNSCHLKEIGGTEYDYATKILGEEYMTPSKAQWEELINNCRVTYTVYNGRNGYVFTGRNYNAIFIPCDKNAYSSDAWKKYYWTSTWAQNNSNGSFGLAINTYYIKNDSYYYSFLSTNQSTIESQIRPVERISK